MPAGWQITVTKSWIGYHSRTYYADFEEPPPSADFSTEWGLMTVSNGSRGDWIEYTNDEVKSKIDDLAGNPDRGPMLKHEAMAKAIFREVQANVASILVTARQLHDDEILRDETEKARALEISSLVDLLREWTPSDARSRDRRALDAGLEAPVDLVDVGNLDDN